MVNTKEIAERMARETQFFMPEAELYGVLATGETFLMGSSTDVYGLLTEQVQKSPLAIIGLAVTTTGWAAPLGENGEVEGIPSEHPARRRVLLVAVVTTEEIMSAIRFADDEEIVTDNGGQGLLAEALRGAFDRVTA